MSKPIENKKYLHQKADDAAATLERKTVEAAMVLVQIAAAKAEIESTDKAAKAVLSKAVKDAEALVGEASKAAKELITLAAETAEALLASVKQLEGIIPICMNCKKNRDDEKSWQQLEQYITDHSDTWFSHGICPDCADMVESSLKIDKD